MSSRTVPGTCIFILGGRSGPRTDVNFAERVMGSVADSPANRVECTSSPYVPVWFMGTYSTVEVPSLFLAGKNPPPSLNGETPSQSREGHPMNCPNTPDGTLVCTIRPAGSTAKTARLVSSFSHESSMAAVFRDGSRTSK